MDMKKSLRAKFIISFVLIITPLVLFLWYSIYYGRDQIRMQASESNRELLSTSMKQIDDRLADLDLYLVNLMVHNGDIKALSSYPYGNKDYIYSKYVLLKKLTGDKGFFRTVSNFFIYVKSNDDFVLGEYTSGDNREYLHENIKDLLEKGATDRWHSLDGDPSSIVRLQAGSSGVYVGAIVSVQDMIETLGDLRRDVNDYVGLVNDKGVDLLHRRQEPQQIDAIGRALKLNSTEYQVFPDFSNQRDYVAVIQQSRLSDVALVKAVPESKMLKPLAFFQFMLYAMPILVILIIGLYILVMQRMLIRPMNALIKGMRGMARGRFDLRIPPRYPGEFSFVIDTFNAMAQKIEHLTINILEHQLKIREADYRRLLSQIRPHFYLNCLNIVYHLAVVNKTETIKKMSMHLAAHFRFTLQQDRSLVTVAEEWEHTRNYLEIQQLRFPNHLSFAIHCADSCRDLLVPPLTVQTFVENSIQHGFKDMNQPFRLDISAEREEDSDTYRIIVRDSGSGFPADELAQISRQPDILSDGGERVGIGNVYQRFVLLFGEQFTMILSNREEGGASVELMLPVQIEEGGPGNV
ncbi:sensor histidine kinase [Cohnella silvisoli]|uniref:Histidine kinase n=1 Tax=Cohnella silvisoli TaxID=2873699 RepID=A0ABV1KT51_9BACL|nr:histidine kinase [Cohnella silvisoli]MCD9021675.1 histidine kinase [Cohnella silvisoli]